MGKLAGTCCSVPPDPTAFARRRNSYLPQLGSSDHPTIQPHHACAAKRIPRRSQPRILHVHAHSTCSALALCRAQTVQ
eukprot:2107500-Prymnesium_polylepis.1